MFKFRCKNKVKERLLKSRCELDTRKSITPKKVYICTDGLFYFGVFNREYYRAMQNRMLKFSNFKYKYKVKQSHASKLFRYNKIFCIKPLQKTYDYYEKTNNFHSKYFTNLRIDVGYKVLCNETRPSIPHNIITKIYTEDGEEHQSLFYDQDRYVIFYNNTTDKFNMCKKGYIFTDKNLTCNAHNGNKFYYENEFAKLNPVLYEKYKTWLKYPLYDV